MNQSNWGKFIEPHSNYYHLQYYQIWLISDPCSAGKYRSADKTSCEACADNTISSEGASTCTPCKAGYAANAQKTKCGTYREV